MASVAPWDRKSLGAIRQSVLALHKTLLDAQRIRYEREHGRVASSGAFLELVLEHPSFEWLRALSSLIARLDALMEADDREVADQTAAVVDALRRLVRFEGNSRFSESYRAIIEQTPDALVAHVQLSRLLTPT